MLEHNIEALIPYFDSRILQTETIEKLKKGIIKETETKGICEASFWLDPEDKAKLLEKTVKETDIKMEFIDIVDMHTYSDAS